MIDKNSDKIKKSGEGIIIEHTEVPTVIHNALDRSDDNTIKKPTKIDLASCGEPSPILPEDRTEITSPYEFTRLWQSIKDKNDLHSRANVLRRIPSEYLLRGKLIIRPNKPTLAPFSTLVGVIGSSRVT